MPRRTVLISLEVIDKPMRRLITSFNGSIQAFYGTTLGSKVILWFVAICPSLTRRHLNFEQPFTHTFPRADIHKLLAPDLLHQLIKRTFKDHLVEWVRDYLVSMHGSTAALVIIEDIDHRWATCSHVGLIPRLIYV